MTEEARRFDELLENFYRAWFRYHPEAALDAGITGYEDRLPPHDDDDIGALITLYEEALGALEECDITQLDADRKLDFMMLKGAAHLGWHELEQDDWRLRDPLRFLPVEAIYQLTIRPVPNLQAALSRRLGLIPRHLRAARVHLSEAPELIPSLWLDAAVDEARSGADFILDLEHHPDFAELELHELLHDAAHALQDFARFLSGLAGSARGQFACGREHFERLLAWRHFLPIGADELYAFGQQLYDQTLRDLQDVTYQLRGDHDIAAMAAQLQREAVSPENLLGVYRQQIEAAHGFVGRSGLLTLPGRNQLEVVETPRFLRQQIPFAAYVQPTPNDPAQRGLYFVTPPQSAAAAGEHNIVSIRHTSVHEAWPGHHLQFVTANQTPASRSLPRLLHPSATLYEGWALYCEQLMHEEGFLDRREGHFMLLRDRLWRALRIMVDVELHVHGVSLGQAVERLASLPGFTPEQARAEVTWYSRAPTTPMAYATGWAMINALRDRVQAEHPLLPRKEFHDRLLASGSVPLALVIGHQFGQDMWQHVAQMVFGRTAERILH